MDNTKSSNQTTDTARQSENSGSQQTDTQRQNQNKASQSQQGEGERRSPEINNNDEGVNDTDGVKRESEIIRADREISEGKNVDASQKKVTGDESQRNVV